MASAITIGADGLYHPRSENDVAELIRWARREGRTVRVRGAAHSVPEAVFGNEGRPRDRF